MDEAEYLELMEFPAQWQMYGLIPPELISRMIAAYEPGMESASEHDRNGFFHWWLKRSPSKDVLIKLVELSFLDPDQLMAGDVRRYIARSEAFDEEVAALIDAGSGEMGR